MEELTSSWQAVATILLQCARRSRDTLAQLLKQRNATQTRKMWVHALRGLSLCRNGSYFQFKFRTTILGIHSIYTNTRLSQWYTVHRWHKKPTSCHCNDTVSTLKRHRFNISSLVLFHNDIVGHLKRCHWSFKTTRLVIRNDVVSTWTFLTTL